MSDKPNFTYEIKMLSVWIVLERIIEEANTGTALAISARYPWFSTYPRHLFIQLEKKLTCCIIKLKG